MGVKVLGIIVFVLGVVTCEQKTEFTGAVYEHDVILPAERQEAYSRQEALNAVMKNLVIYNQQAMLAARQRVNILVFPEFGLYGWNYDRYNITPFLEHVPEIGQRLWNPCMSHSGGSQETKIQFELSCIARNNSLYVVANLGSMTKCDENEENPRCPEEGHYQYNTAVVFDPNGKLIAKYNKWNLYQEPQFDYPKKSEMVTFETPFGIFGLFMCSAWNQFDPAIRMIEEMEISNFVCPGSWSDLPPNKIAIQDHLGIARGYGVNILAANIHKPDLDKHGSGIYTPGDETKFYYEDRPDSRGKLVVTPVVKVLRRPLRQKIPQYNVKMQTEGPGLTTFTARVNNDAYTFVALKEHQGTVKLCASEMCCELEYTVNLSNEDEYVFGVYSGYHLDKGNHYRFYQSCIVTRCNNVSEHYCGVAETSAKSFFTHLRINGYFSTKYVYPQFLVSNRGQFDVAPTKWHYQDGVLWSRQTVYPLESAGFFGRLYSRDTTSNSIAISASVIHLSTCFLIWNML